MRVDGEVAFSGLLANVEKRLASFTCVWKDYQAG